MGIHGDILSFSMRPFQHISSRLKYLEVTFRIALLQLGPFTVISICVNRLPERERERERERQRERQREGERENIQRERERE